MKLVLILAALGLSFAATAADTLDGCGLGWQVNDKKTYTATTTRGTTNAFVPPTFGMTTGTMGCDKLDVGRNDKEAADYVATNFETLKSELAVGQGEYVSALAKTMNCSSAQFGTEIQKHYDSVVAPAANAVQLYKGIKAQTREICI